MIKKRKIFDELMEGIGAMKAHCEGKLTLRSYKAALPRILRRWRWSFWCGNTLIRSSAWRNWLSYIAEIAIPLAAIYFFGSFRARFLIQIGVPTNPNASRIWFSRNR
jgi:hypothetical protein